MKKLALIIVCMIQISGLMITHGIVAAQAVTQDSGIGINVAQVYENNRPPFQETDEIPPDPEAELDENGHWYRTTSNTPGPLNSPMLIGATGGPDDFGYTWDDSGTVSWISGTTDSGMGGNTWDQAVALPLGFNFKYYENTYSNVYVVGSGYLGFTEPDYWDTFLDIPSPSSPNNIIAPYSSDFDLSSTADGDNRIYYAQGGSEPNRYFVAEWRSVVDTWGNTWDFEVVLHENGDFEIQYGSIDIIYTYWCLDIGNEDSSGTDGLVYMEGCPDPAYFANNRVYFTRPAAAARVSVDPKAQGRFTEQGSSVDFWLTIRNTGELGEDCYDLSFTSTWTPVQFREVDGTTPLTNTCGNSSVDTGNIAQGDSKQVLVKITHPAALPAGVNNTANLIATSTVNGAVSRSATLQMTSPASFAQVLILPELGVLLLDLNQPGESTSVPYGSYTWGTPSIAKTPSGYVITWYVSWCRDYNCEVAASEIYAAITDEAGNLITPIIQVTDNSTVTEDFYFSQPVPAVSPDGRIGITWRGRHTNLSTGKYKYNIYFAILGADGSTLLAPTNVTNNPNYYSYGEINGIYMDYTGLSLLASKDYHFILAWHQRQWVTGGGRYDDIYTRIYSSSGNSLLAATKLTNDSINPNTSIYTPSMTLLTSNRVFMVYINSGETCFLVMNSNGTIIKTETVVDTTGYNYYRPDAIQLSTGEILVAWEHYNYEADEQMIRYRMLNGTTYLPVNSASTLDNIISSQNYYPSVTADNAGHGIITWIDDDERYIFYALLDHSGTVLTQPMIYHSAQEYSIGSIGISSRGAGNVTRMSTKFVYLPLVIRP